VTARGEGRWKEVTALSKVPTFHTTEPEDPEVYHDDDECPYGKNIKSEHRAYGTGGRDKCSWCRDH
jgi:hypothetical protein